MSWGGAWSALLRSLRLPYNAGPGDPSIFLDGTQGEITVTGADPGDKIIITPNGAAGVPQINMQGASAPGDTVAGIQNDPAYGLELIGAEYIDFYNGDLVRQRVRLSEFQSIYGGIDASGQSEGGHLSLVDDLVSIGFINQNAMLHGIVIDDTGVRLAHAQTTLGRGLWNRVDSVANSAGVAAATEAVVLTLPATDYLADRAYEVKTYGGAQGNVANCRVFWRLRKTNVAGAQVCLYYRTDLAALGAAYDMGHTARVFTIGGTDVTAALVLTLIAEVGTVTHMVNAGSHRAVEIWDVGEAVDFPQSPVLS